MTRVSLIVECARVKAAGVQYSDRTGTGHPKKVVQYPRVSKASLNDLKFRT